MKWQLPPNSLFAILLRSRWWISLMVAVGVFGAARLLLPTGLAAFAALPFVVIAIYAGWQQLFTPGPERVAETLERARAMTWEAFSAELEEAFRRQGYAVTRLNGPQLDLELSRAGRATVVGARRWKAMRTGIEPMREFHAAARKRDANERVYVAAGELSDNARSFARDNNIRLLEGVELAKMLAK